MERGDGSPGGEQSAALDSMGSTGGRRRRAGAPQVGSGRREISARTVRLRCLKDGAGGRDLWFGNARITGPVLLADVLIDRLLRFTDCEFTDPIDLTGMRASAGIHLVDCKIRSLQADRLSVQGDLVLERICSNGLISLRGARLAGHLRCTGSQFLAGKAFNGLGMVIHGSALFDGGFRSAGEFTLASAKIDGSLDMTGASLASKEGTAMLADGIGVGTGLFLNSRPNATFNAEGTVRLAEAHISGKLKCTGGHFRALTPGGMAIEAQLIEADEVCLDEGFEATGEVCLDGITVKGRMTCEGGKFSNRGGTALRANGLDCRDVRLGREFLADGEVQLMGARISREFNCSNGRFYNENGVALTGEGLICDGKIYFNENFQAHGQVRLHNARIKNELNCTNGHFTTLEAGGLTCDGNVYLNDGFKAADGVQLMDATVGCELNCDDGIFGKFDARRLTVGAKFDWRPRQFPEIVNVSFADVGLLVDDPSETGKSWPKSEKQDDSSSKQDDSKTNLLGFISRKLGRGEEEEEEKKTNLIGFIFRNLGRGEEEEEGKTSVPDEKALVDRRISWLGDASYAPGAYQQLSRIYQQKGMDREAREIAIAGQRDRRKRGGMRTAPWIWNGFLDKTVRYGYAMHRPLVAVLFAGLVGTVFFYLAQAHGLMEAVSPPQGVKVEASNCTPSYPCFFPLTYAFEIFLPVINLRQVNFWLPDAATGWGLALLVWVWFAIVSGWVITVALASGIGYLFSQRD